jgi:plastocyanin
VHFLKPLILHLSPALLTSTILATSAVVAVPVDSATPAATPRRVVSGRATGRIEGTVEISSALSTRRPVFRIYSDPGIGAVPSGSRRDPVTAELRNVVLYLEGDPEQLNPSAARMESRRHGSMAQRDEHFVPHVLPVVQGATVDFPNQDDVYHNVFSLSAAAGFDLGRYPKGTSRSFTFVKPGTVQVFCHIHSDMSATILVLANPYFTQPDDDHHYVIDDVPEGDYTIVGWHERVKPITRRIHVAAGQTTVLDFNIPVPQGDKPAR